MTTLRFGMKSLAVVGAISMASQASAQQAHNWNGFYAGLNAGAAWTTSDMSNTVCPSTVANFLTCYFESQGVAPGGIPPTGAGNRLNGVGSGTLSDKAFTGGAQVGYNWQLSSLVLGVEADLNSMKTSVSRIAGTTYAAGGTSGVNFTDAVSTDYMATVRGRIGYATGDLLAYFTGGAAFANFKHSHSATEFGLGAGCSAATNFCDVPGSATTKMGWTVGGGAEWALDRHWSLKAEYLYADFSTVTSASNMNGFTHQPLSGPDRADRARGYQLQVLN